MKSGWEIGENPFVATQCTTVDAKQIMLGQKNALCHVIVVTDIGSREE